MRPPAPSWAALRRIIAHGTQAAGWVSDSVRTALGAVSGTVATITRPAAVRGLVVETGVLIAHLVMYPWGALSEQRRPGELYDCYRPDDLPPAKRALVITDSHSAGMPVVLVHGFADNRSAFTVLRRVLHRQGFSVVYSLNYGLMTTLTGDVRSAARILGREVEQICAATNATQVQVVGHSLGGLVARYYIQRLGGDTRVHTLVTLGTPHQGTMAAYLLPTPVLRQLRPNSDLMIELAAPAPGCRTRFVAVWSQLDGWVLPQRNATLEHPDLLVTNSPLSDVGHLSLPVDPRAVDAVVHALTQPSASAS
jgi:pimeloyl-ACP methyl ester carboxylesterase